MAIKKILVIFGSARKYNSYKATKKFEEELTKLGDYKFEYIFLSSFNLETCMGCHNCLFKGEESCPVKDDKNILYDKMLDSDGIVIVSPVYVVNVSALIKNFIDRLCFVCHRPAFFKQNVMIISTTAVLGLKPVLKYLKDVANVWGSKSVTTLGLLTSPESVLNDKNLLKIRKSAQTYHEKFQNKELIPTTSQMIQFEMQKAIFTSDGAKTVLPADYKHYTKIKDKNYYVDAKINPLKKGISKMFRIILYPFILKPGK